MDALQCQNKTGRPDYPLWAMWRLCLVKFLLKIRYNNALLEYLRGNQKVRELCGFGDQVPSESALSRFVSRLADHQELIEQCFINLTGQLREMVPKVKKRPGKQDQPLPSLGAVTAVDSILFETYANPNRPVISDPDARWGVKHSSRTKEGKTEWSFGLVDQYLFEAAVGLLVFAGFFGMVFLVSGAKEGKSLQRK